MSTISAIGLIAFPILLTVQALILMRVSNRLVILGDALMVIVKDTSRVEPGDADRKTCPSVEPSSDTERL